MKSLFFLFLLIYSQFVVAQYYIRTKKNIGVYSSYNFAQNRSFQPSLQLGFCSQIGRHFIPEIGVSIVTLNENPAFRSFNAGLQYRTHLLRINQRKIGAKCKGELIDLFVAPEYIYTPNNSFRMNENSYSLRYGLALHHYESGGSRLSRAWNTKLEAYHRNYFGNTTPIKNEFGIALRIQYFKTYDFLR